MRIECKIANPKLKCPQAKQRIPHSPHRLGGQEWCRGYGRLRGRVIRPGGPSQLSVLDTTPGSDPADRRFESSRDEKLEEYHALLDRIDNCDIVYTVKLALKDMRQRGRADKLPKKPRKTERPPSQHVPAIHWEFAEVFLYHAGIPKILRDRAPLDDLNSKSWSAFGVACLQVVKKEVRERMERIKNPVY